MRSISFDQLQRGPGINKVVHAEPRPAVLASGSGSWNPSETSDESVALTPAPDRDQAAPALTTPLPR